MFTLFSKVANAGLPDDLDRSAQSGEQVVLG